MIKILIADDHAIVRLGLKQLLGTQPDMEVAAEAMTGGEVLELVHAHDYDVVILDVAMPGLNGVDVLQRLRASKPELPVLILSGFAEKQYAFNLMRSGANGYLSKESASDELLRAIRTVATGGKYVSAGLAQSMVQEMLDNPDGRPAHATLSEREFQIFCKLAQGTSVSEIAEELSLSVKTISTYRSRVLDKMSMRSNADITAYAIKNQLIH